MPRGTAELQASDKVNARSATLPVKVGSSATYGSLTITVQAEHYFEEGELSSTEMTGAMFAQTPEEKQAGFE